MPTHHLTAFSAAPPERVFDLWTNVDRMREWVGGVTKVTDLTGAIDRPGTRYVVWFGPIKSPTEVLEAERPRRFKTRFGNWLLRGTNSTTFEPEGDGTRITEEFVTEGLVSAITSRLFGLGSYKGSYQGELNEFARLAEREAGGGGNAWARGLKGRE